MAVGVERGQITFALGGAIRQWVGFVELFPADEFLAACEGPVWNVLNSLQDFVIAEAGIQPWPDPESCGLTRAEVEVSEGEIRFWYGDKAEPALRFEPIRVADLS